jgi:3-hydroxyisobutyrate dehydrogenase
MNTTKIGWIGLGTMGVPMSQRLISAGYPVTVYNRNREKETALKNAGAATADKPAALIKNTDVVFLMVSDDQAIRDLFQGDDGLLSAATSGKLIINMSTVSPAISVDMAGKCQEQGNEYLDAPVSGSVKQALDGQLVIMVGGERPAYEQATPLFQHLGKLALYLGSQGNGNTAKLAINLLLSIHSQGLAEAILFAQQSGIRTEDFMTIFNNGAMTNVYAKIKGDAIIAGNYNAAFSIKNIAKDLRLAKAEGGLTTPLAREAYTTFQQAETKYGDLDIIAVIKTLADQQPAAKG